MPSFPLPRPCLWLRLSLATALFAGLLAGTAGAQVQDKAQQGCITGLGKAAAKVLKSQALDVYACVGLGALGRELDPATCLAADRKGKVAKAESKTQPKPQPEPAAKAPTEPAPAETIVPKRDEALSSFDEGPTDVFGGDDSSFSSEFGVFNNLNCKNADFAITSSNTVITTNLVKNKVTKEVLFCS